MSEKPFWDFCFMAKINFIVYFRFPFGIYSSSHIASAQLTASLAAAGGEKWFRWGCFWHCDLVQSQWVPEGHCCLLSVTCFQFLLTAFTFTQMFTVWLDEHKRTSSSHCECEMGPCCGSLIKLTNCVRLLFLLVLVTVQLGLFPQIWRVIQPWSSKSTYRLKSD